MYQSSRNWRQAQAKITFRVCTENKRPNPELKGRNLASLSPLARGPSPVVTERSNLGLRGVLGRGPGLTQLWPQVRIHGNTLNFPLGFATRPFRRRSGLAGCTAAFLAWVAFGHTKLLSVPKADHAGLGLPTERRCVLPAVAGVAARGTRASSLRKVSAGLAGGTGSERLGRARPGAGLALTFPLLFSAVT